MMESLARLSAALSDRYTIDRELGAGGMATVYLARDLKHDRQVAVKVLRPEIAVALGTERFLQEIQIAAKLNHPHILVLHDSGEADGFLYYVMPHVEGESLRDRLNREKQLSIEDALRVTEQIAGALGYAHGQEIVHRDIKPENILLHEGVAMVADFGIAFAVSAAGGERLTETGLSVGTPEYMSPEQGTGEPHIDGRSDVYSLACVLYEMLAGEPPFTGPTAQAVIAKRMADPPPAVRRVRQNVGEPLDRALRKALANVPADRYAHVGEFARALRARRVPGRRRRRVAFAAAAVATLGVSVALAVRGRGSVDLNPDRIAVAPFDVLAPGLELWREGLVDVLSASLDGAGPLRTVPPSVVIKRWTGRADAASALRLGGNHGARFVVFGRLQPAGLDSARLSVVLYDVGRSVAVEEFELRDTSERIDRLADSTAVRLLAAVNSVRPIGAVPLQSLGSSSPAALKAFLQGEQHYRRSSFDSAVAFYQEASDLDSTFALALNRRGWAIQYGAWLTAPPVDSLFLRAARLNHGLARRESLLVTADSIYSALTTLPQYHREDALLSRLHETAERATREYPDDPQLWMTLGEARMHWPIVGSSDSATIAAFARAIRTDSAFAPPYFHLIDDLLLTWDEPAEARRTVDAFLALDPPVSAFSVAARAMSALLRAPRPVEELERVLDTLPTDRWPVLISFFIRAPEPSELSIKAEQRLAAARPDLAEARAGLLDWMSAYRGHIREPATRADTSDSFGAYLFAELALLGAIPPEQASEVIGVWARSDNLARLFIAYDWFVAQGDTVGLGAAASGIGAAVRAGTVGPSVGARYAVSRDALVALARGETASAFEMLREVPMGTAPDRLDFLHARLFNENGMPDRAIDLLDRSILFPWTPSQVLWILERGRAHESLGNSGQAARAYSYVANTWINADPELAPFVEEARAALARLAGEPRR